MESLCRRAWAGFVGPDVSDDPGAAQKGKGILLSRAGERGAGRGGFGRGQTKNRRENRSSADLWIFRRGAFRAPVRALEAGAGAGVRRLLGGMVERAEGEPAVGEKWRKW